MFACKLLILGGGSVVRELYVPALRALNWEPFTTVIEPSEKSRALLVASGFPKNNIQSADFRSWLDDSSLVRDYDGVVVALPNRFHEAAVAICLAAGKDVLCEKPLALNEKACLNLAGIALQHGRSVSVGMVLRLTPFASTVSYAIDQGWLGDVQSVDISLGNDFNWNASPSELYRKDNGGVLADLGVHYLDLAEHWLGSLDPIQYRDDYQGGIETNLEYHLKSKRDVEVRIRLSQTHQLRNTIVIRGSHAELTIDKTKITEATLCCRDGRQFSIGSTGIFDAKGSLPTLHHCFVRQLVEFAEVIDRKSTPRVGPQAAASTAKLIRWGYENRKPLFSSLPRSGRPTIRPSKAVITGGTGFIGGHLIERLIELGFNDLSVFLRRPLSQMKVARFPLESTPVVDLLDYREVEQRLKRVRYVFHLAFGADGADADAVTVQGTKNVVDAAIANGVEAIVVVGSIASFGNTLSSTPIDEHSHPHPTDDYGKNKLQAEEYCLVRARSSDLTRIVVISPAAVFGPGGKTFATLPSQMAKRGEFCWVEEGKGMANLTYVGNVVDALVLAATHKDAHGNRFIISDQKMSWLEYFCALWSIKPERFASFDEKQLKAMNDAPKPNIRDVARVLLDPKAVAVLSQFSFVARAKKSITFVFPSLRRYVSKARSQDTGPAKQSGNRVPPSWIASLFGPQKTLFSSQKAIRILGWRPLVSINEAIKLTRNWLEDADLLPEPKDSSEKESNEREKQQDQPRKIA